MATPLALASLTQVLPSTSHSLASPVETISYSQGKANGDAALTEDAPLNQEESSKDNEDPQSPPQSEQNTESSPPKTIPLEKDETQQFEFPYPIMQHVGTQTDPAPVRNLASFIYSEEFQRQLAMVQNSLVKTII